jgi:hypothetical protein
LLIDGGTTNVDGTTGDGGTITQNANEILQSSVAKLSANSQSAKGGTITLNSSVRSGNQLYLSGSISTTGKDGGAINATSNKVTLSGATLDSSGTNNAGTIKIGGGWQGSDTTINNASETTVTNTKITNNGANGKIVVWSDKETLFGGDIKAKNSIVEVSSKNSLGFGGTVDAKSLLLDPKNIEIREVTGSLDYLTIENPNGISDDYFGNSVAELSNGNIVITALYSDIQDGAADVGRVYLYSPTGTLISTLSGTTTNDNVGYGGITALSNGNYVVASNSWHNGTTAFAGAVTWGSGTTGISGVISSANSLVGTTANDYVGNGGIIALSNGNYVVASSYWNNGSVESVGAVTWGSGTTGIRGVISSANSLVGTTSYDLVGNNGVTALSNGNYVVASSYWDNGTVNEAGAVTWGSGTTGISGEVSSANSLVGTTADDQVGRGVTALTNGNYVVISANWNNGTATYAGAVTWGDGTTGISGEVSSANSLVGTTADDQVGSYDVIALTNGNYVVISSEWDNGTATDVGAVTWGSGTTGISGAVSSANSILGASENSYFGENVSLLQNNKLAISDTSSSIGGTVYISDGSSLNGGDTVSSATFANNQSANSIITPTTIKALLDAGTAVTLQANNDITVTNNIIANNASGNGGALTLEAGRNININANIVTDNGNFNAIAGSSNALSEDTDTGTPTITIASGTTIDAGTGTITLYSNDGDFVNDGGATPFTAALTTIYLPSYTNATLGGLTIDGKRYNTSYVDGCLTTDCEFPTSGVNLLYSLAPKLTVTPTTGRTSIYGNSFTASGYTLSGYVDGDTVNTSGISGTASFTIGGDKSTSDNYIAGVHDIAYSLGLLSSLGYSFVDATTQIGELIITKKAITVSADDLSKIYGATDATLTYTATGLIGTDSLAGSLKRVAGENVGEYAISQDTTLANSNYTVTFENGVYTITPKAITVVADDLSKIYGATDATLTYTASGLLGTDSLTGSLTRVEGENVGEYAISEGTLANSNYTVTFENGIYTITPKSITVKADNKEKSSNAHDPEFTYVATGLINEDTLAGTLVRESGENAGKYAISKGSLGNENYNIAFEDGVFTIKNNTIIEKQIAAATNTNTMTATSKLVLINPMPFAMKYMAQPNIQIVNNSPFGAALQAKLGISTGEGLTLSSQAPEGTTTQVITSSELQELMFGEPDMAQNNDMANLSKGQIRVPLDENSMIVMVGDGQKLPNKLDQQYYASKPKSPKKKK